jgi:histidine ammonia-lyase
MGTIASRDCLRVLELSEQVAAAMLVAVRQGVALRLRTGYALPAALQPFVDKLDAAIPLIGRDRALEAELRMLLQEIRESKWS